jgi:5'-methylthioadenosine phosphorylase
MKDFGHQLFLLSAFSAPPREPRFQFSHHSCEFMVQILPRRALDVGGLPCFPPGTMEQAAIGIIGGSGLYELDGFEKSEERVIETPFGEPSDAIVGGTFAGRQVWFLPRHGRGHRILPTEINHRANLWALRSLNVRWLICVTAVGSLKEEYAPRDVVLPDQFFDRTSRREHHTFFGRGIVGHVSFAEPFSAGLRGILKEAATGAGCPAS